MEKELDSPEAPTDERIFLDDAKPHPSQAFDFTHMTPEKIVDVHRDIFNQEYDGPDDLADGLVDAFMFGMENLINTQPELAGDVVESLATNVVDHTERRTAAYLIEKLAKTNKEAALILADTLLRDTSDGVRETTHGAVGAVFKDKIFTPIEALALFRTLTNANNTTMGTGENGL
jgi:hypothetical protein